MGSVQDQSKRRQAQSGRATRSLENLGWLHWCGQLEQTKKRKGAFRGRPVCVLWAQKRSQVAPWGFDQAKQGVFLKQMLHF